MGTGSGEVSFPPGGGGGVAGPLNGNFYRISDADGLGDGSPKEKFERNVAAIRLLRDLDDTGRAATAEEKAALVKYSGWGGLPQAFATAAEAPKWKAEQAALKELLRPGEYASARATVLNSHYTSPLVIQSMYAALTRLSASSFRSYDSLRRYDIFPGEGFSLSQSCRSWTSSTVSRR